MKAIAPVKQKVDRDNIGGLPPLIMGGATLNTQYNDDPTRVPLVSMLRYAMDHGIRGIDTSPYYGPSETLYGNALDAIKDEYARDTYYICTKVGRIRLDEFDYTREHVRFSVQRSCARLKTTYLDLVYLHDVEFVELSQIFEALEELRSLKDEGIIRNFGLSGYPVPFLQYVAEKCCSIESIGPLDAVLSYCNLNLQNTILHDYYDRFKKDSHIKCLSNGSILSMSLLRSEETKSFHPCSRGLRDCAFKAAKFTQDSYNVELADLATRFAIKEWIGKGPTVLGVSNIEELKTALTNYWAVVDNDNELSAEDQTMVDKIQKDIFAERMNEIWESGIPHNME